MPNPHHIQAPAGVQGLQQSPGRDREGEPGAGAPRSQGAVAEGTQPWEVAGDGTVHGAVHEPGLQAPNRRSIDRSDFTHSAQIIKNFKTVTQSIKPQARGPSEQRALWDYWSHAHEAGHVSTLSLPALPQLWPPVAGGTTREVARGGTPEFGGSALL